MIEPSPFLIDGPLAIQDAPVGEANAPTRLARVRRGVFLIGLVVISACSRPSAIPNVDPGPQLGSTRAAQREAALDELIQAHDRPSTWVPLIVPLLEDPDPAVAGKAALALSRFGAASFEAIHQLLRQGSPQEKLGATIALSRTNTETTSFLPILIDQLTEEDPALVEATLSAISQMRSSSTPAIAALSRLLTHEDVQRRWAAARALATVGPAAEPALPEIAKCLRDESLQVRLAAADAHWRIRPPKPIAPHVLAEHVDWLNHNLPQLLHDHRVPGASIAIIHRGRVHWSGGFGVRDVRVKEPTTPRTIFEACSMSKPILAQCALRLIQSRRLDLDRPLVDYLGRDYLLDQPDHRRITARMALTHRTGFPNWRKGYDEMGGPLPVLFPPGSDEGYSGEGILFLQRAIEAISRMSFDQFAREHLFAPLGLRRTSFVWTEEIDRDLASGHTAEGQFLMKTNYRKPNGAYSLYTTPSEYAELMLTLINPTILGDHAFSPQCIELLLRRHQVTSMEDPIVRPGLAQTVTSYRALAWRIDVTAEGDVAYHSGSNSSGFKTYGQFNLQKGSGLVIFTNGSNGSAVWKSVVAKLGDL